MEGKVCTKCGVWKPLEEYHKDKTKKDGRRPNCRECQKQRYSEKHPKKVKEVREGMKKVKEVREGMKKCSKCGAWKLLEEYNKDKKRKDGRQYECRECKKEGCKQHYQNNKEYYKQRYQNNKEYYKEHDRQHRENNKENNLQYISSIVEQINPVFKQLNLPVYGYVYVFENIKTGHKYVGQSILPIARRYAGGIVQGWIKERLEKVNQKFKEELIEEDIVVTEVLDVAFCQYHLDKLEAYYIDKYDSFLNGYNNREGNHNTDDGIEEFNQILAENNLEFIDGKLVKIA